MSSKWLTARPKNMQPAAPRKHVMSSWGISEGCYACRIKDESAPVIIKSDYNSNDAMSIEEEKPVIALLAVMVERQNGDGQESPEPEKKKVIKKSPKQVQHDEDQKNPAYVPRSGYFFEHDLRCTNNGGLRAKKLGGKNHRQEERWWIHDRFQEDKQAPKSREELIAKYGYDIRACQIPDATPPCQPKKQRNQNKRRRRAARHSQCSSSASSQRTYKDLQDLHKRQSKIVSSMEKSEDLKKECSACYRRDESTKGIIKSEYNSNDDPSMEEEKPKATLVMGKRQNGDGQESPKLEMKKVIKKSQSLDYVEDQKNSGYIPQRRCYYEHDLHRTNDGRQRTRNFRTQKHGKDKGRWKHDRFKEDEQGPKSKQELIAAYGYDIWTCTSPYEIPPRQPTKQSNESRAKVEVQNERQRRPENCSQSSASLERKEFQDHYKRQSPSKRSYCESAGYKDEQPEEFSKNESTGFNFLLELFFQAQGIKQPIEGSTSQENEAKWAVEQRALIPKKPLAKMSYARTRRSRIKRGEVIEMEMNAAFYA